MPPRKSTSRGANTPQPAEPADAMRYGAAIQNEMPPLPPMVMSSYGSATVAPLINIRGGRRRELGDIIGEALREPTDDISDLMSERMLSPEPFPRDPLPELVPSPDPSPPELGDTNSSHESGPQDSDEDELRPQESDEDEFRPPESEGEELWSEPPSPTPPPPKRAPRKTPAARKAPASRAPSLKPEPPTVPPVSQPRISTTPVPPPKIPTQMQAPPHRPTRQDRPAPQPVVHPTPQSQRQPTMPLSFIPRPNERVFDSSRSFGVESDIFKNATITSPSVNSERPASSSPPEPPSGSLRERLARARSKVTATPPAPQVRGKSSAISQGPLPTMAGAPSGPSTTRKKAGAAKSPSERPPEPERSASSQSGTSRLRPDRIWRAIKPTKSVLEYLRSLFIVLLVFSAVWGLPSLLTSVSIPEWGTEGPLDRLSQTWDQFNPFPSLASNASIAAARGEYKKLAKEALDAIKSLENSSKIFDGSARKIEELLPSVVKMERKNGKLSIPDDFWHALRDSIKADGDIVTVKGTSPGSRLAHGKHWDAILGHIDDDLANGKQLSRSWETWLRKNNDKVVEMLQLDQRAPADLDAKAKDAIKALIDEGLRRQDRKETENETVVTRDEFMRHLRGEFTTHRGEILAEMKELKAELEAKVQRALDSAANSAAQLSHRDMKRLVQETVRSQLSSAHLGAQASAGIRASWELDLQHRVNFLAHSMGAIVDEHQSSPTYRARKAPVGSLDWLISQRGPPPLPHSKVLVPWQDSGDAWCGATTVDRKERAHNGVTLSIQLSRSIKPEHVVVEHILPEGTLDPDARPREIEIWAHVEGVRLQQLLLDFAGTHFPPRTQAGLEDGYPEEAKPASETNPVCDGPECFYLIGRFEYESNVAHGGVFVHRLSDELGSMGVSTDHVRFVARSNYGDKDKTCFYRIRMFGEIMEEV